MVRNHQHCSGSDERDALATDGASMTGARSWRRVRAMTINLPPQAELDALVREVQSAVNSAGDLDLVVLPESCRGVGPDVAEPADGPTVAALATIARDAGTYLLVGVYLSQQSGNHVA